MRPGERSLNDCLPPGNARAQRTRAKGSLGLWRLPQRTIRDGSIIEALRVGHKPVLIDLQYLKFQIRDRSAPRDGAGEQRWKRPPRGLQGLEPEPGIATLEKGKGDLEVFSRSGQFPLGDFQATGPGFL